MRRGRSLAGVRARSPVRTTAPLAPTSPQARPPWLPPLNALHAFEAAGRRLSFKAAAAELSVTPSAISRQIKVLEDQLGVPLFLRGHRTLALTAAGAAYLAEVERMFAALAEATASVRQASGATVVRLSIVQPLAANWLVPRLAEFAAAHPELEVQIVTGEQLADVSGGEVELAIRFGQGGWPGLRADLLLPVTVFPVAAPKLAATLRRPAQLLEQPWLHLTLFPQAFRAWLAHAGLPDLVAARNLTFDNGEVLLRAAEHGMGVAMATHALVEPYLRRGQLVRPFRDEAPIDGGYYLVARADLVREPAVAKVHRWLLSLR